MSDSTGLQTTMLRNRLLENIFAHDESSSSAKAASQDTIGDQITNDSADLYFFSRPTNDSEDSSDVPSCSPSSSSQPSYSSNLSLSPTTSPSQSPTYSLHPSTSPTRLPLPSSEPSTSASIAPSSEPSEDPSTIPTAQPSFGPSMNPTQTPTVIPTAPMLLSVPFPSYYLTVILESARRRIEEAPGRFLSLDKITMDHLMNELDVVLEDYMVQGLNEEFGGLVAKFIGVDLMVLSNDDGSSPQRQLLREGLRVRTWKRDRRILQVTETATFLVNGNTTFSTTDENTFTEEDLSLETDGAVESLLRESNEEQFLYFVRTHPKSDLLRNVLAITASIEKAPTPGSEQDTGSDKPSVVSIIFGFLLVLVAVISLSVYVYIFGKKLKKHFARGKQKRNGAQSHASSKTERVSPERTIQSLGSSRVAPATISSNQDSSSSRPIPHPVVEVGKSWSGEDIFARELQQAASFDRKAWDDYQQNHQYEERAPMMDPCPKQSSHRNAFEHIRRDTQPYYNVETQLGDGTTPKLPTFEKRATIFASPIVEGRADSFFTMGDKETKLVHKDVNNDCTPYISDWEDSSISDSNSEEEEGAISLKVYDGNLPSAIERADGSTISTFSNPFPEFQRPQSDALSALPRYTHIQASPQQRSACNRTHTVIVESPGYNLRTQKTAQFAPWSQTSEVVTPYHRNIGMVSVDPPRRTLEDMSNDLESLLTSETVHEVQTLSRFMKGYDKRKWRKERARKVENLLGATKRPTNRSILDVEYDLLNECAKGTRHQSTQTAGSDLREDETDDEGSISEGSSTFASCSISESSARNSRLGIGPRSVQILGFSSEEGQGGRLEPHLVDVKALFGHPEGALSSDQRSNVSSNIVATNSLLSVSSAGRGSSIIVEWPTNDLRHSPAQKNALQLGGIAGLRSPTTLPPRQQNQRFGNITPIYEFKPAMSTYPTTFQLPPPPPPPPPRRQQNESLGNRMGVPPPPPPPPPKRY